jgi:hypothetical protein
VVLHYRPHLDEIVALFLAQNYGQRLFPGAKDADIEFRDAGAALSGRSADDWEQRGTLFLGVGGGRFDEHPTPGTDQTKVTSCAQLVAGYLGVADRPELKALLAYTTDNDLTGGSDGRYGLARLINQLNALEITDPDVAVGTSLLLIAAVVHQAKQFTLVAGRELKQAQRSVFTPSGGEHPLKLVVIQTDCEQVKARAFSSLGGQQAAIVQRNSKGQIQLFVNPFDQLDLAAVAADIRRAELEARDIKSLYSQAEIQVPGTLPGVPEWLYHPETGMLANGTLTSPNTPVTRLSLEKVTQIFIKHIRIAEAEATA